MVTPVSTSTWVSGSPDSTPSEDIFSSFIPWVNGMTVSAFCSGTGYSSNGMVLPDTRKDSASVLQGVVAEYRYAAGVPSADAERTLNCRRLAGAVGA